MTDNLFSVEKHGGKHTEKYGKKPTAAERFQKREKLRMENMEAMLREHLSSVLQKGYFGSAGFSLSIHDGIIQHIGLQMDFIMRGGYLE